MRKSLLASIAFLTLLLAAGCQAPPEQMAPQRTAAEVDAAFETLRADWQSMANADDAAGVAAFYTDDAVFIDVYGNAYEGREAITAYFEGSFASSSALDIQTTDMVVHGDMVAGYGTFSQTVTGPDGEMQMSGMWMTVSLYQADGSVKIRLHQSALPSEPPPGM